MIPMRKMRVHKKLKKILKLMQKEPIKIPRGAQVEYFYRGSSNQGQYLRTETSRDGEAFYIFRPHKKSRIRHSRSADFTNIVNFPKPRSKKKKAA
jgi:hypothetical protein